jgi:hypothetical protein
MAYEFTVDQDRKLLIVRYSGAVTVAERQAAAEHVLGEATSPDLRRVLLDYRRATSFATDVASNRKRALYRPGMLGGRRARVAWLVTYDHQLDPTVERLLHDQGVPNHRFRDQDAAMRWLLEPDAEAQSDAPASAGFTPAPGKPTGASTSIHLGLGTPDRSRRAQGRFDVKVLQQSPDNPPARTAGLARLSLDKRYHGTLDASGRGEMLADGGADRQQGAYVAMERVDGMLEGRVGTFALVHRALMRGGVPQDWTVVVVPGSGTGRLAGLEGSMRITLDNDQHAYDFEYVLPD